VSASSRCAVEVKEGKVAERLSLRMSTLELTFVCRERTGFSLAGKVNLDSTRRNSEFLLSDYYMRHRSSRLASSRRILYVRTS
jgi:hypothetical protein